jgi:hypothetical protein
MAYYGAGQGKHQMSLEHLYSIKSKELLKKQTQGWGISKRYRNWPERAPNSKAGIT